MAPVGRRVRPVAGEGARQQTRDGIAAEPVRDEVVGAVRHGDDEMRPRAGSLALEQRREHANDRAECAGREIGHLYRRPAGGGVLEDTGPAEVVEVVARA